MNPKYVSEVRRFGGPNHNTDSLGNRKNLSHSDDIDPRHVKTDGLGNVIAMPLVRNKSCFGRPERILRGLFGGKPWIAEDGSRRMGGTTCSTCEGRSLGTFLACNDVIAERIASSADVERACVEWIDGTGRQFGPSCFLGSDKHRWEAFLVAIENHGGWSNINDEQVKIDAVAAGELAKKHRRDSAKRRRDLEKQRRQGAVRSLTPELLAAVKEEGGSRANHLKTLKVARGAKPQDTLWITSLPDSTCE